MNKLIIRAHPKHNTGYNFALCTAIQAAAQHAGHHVEMIDLYHEMPQGFLRYDNKPIAHQKEIQGKLTRADEYIFVFPIWGVDCPAILKNFIDVNMGRGFGYETQKLANGKTKTVKLLTNKTARIVATAGGPTFFYPFIWFVIWNKGRLGFNGIRTRSMHLIGNVVNCSQGKREKFMASVAKITGR